MEGKRSFAAIERGLLSAVWSSIIQTDGHSREEHSEGGVSKLIDGGTGEVGTAGAKCRRTIIRSFSL